MLLEGFGHSLLLKIFLRMFGFCSTTVKKGFRRGESRTLSAFQEHLPKVCFPLKCVMKGLQSD